ncbi:MAG: CPBP family intramembrane glutamic endopeptidase [Candidatus Latescibacterota bacterium]
MSDFATPTAIYPSPRQVSRLALVAIPLSYLVAPALGRFHPPHLGVAAAELVLLALVAAYIRRHRWQPENLLLLNAAPTASFVLAGAAGLGASLLIGEFDLLVSDVLEALGLRMPLMVERSALRLYVVRGPVELALAVVSLVAVPAVCEETFFRGFVFTSTCARRGAAWAVVASSLLFGAAHVNPWQLPALILFGLFLALLVYRTHSIYPAILAHGLNNLLYLAGTNLHAHRGTAFFDPCRHVPLPVTLAALALFATCLMLLGRQPTWVPLIDHRPLPPAQRRTPMAGGSAP